MDLKLEDLYIQCDECGGSTCRRMFTLNLCSYCKTSEEIQELKKYIDSHARFLIDHLHSDLMRHTASPPRLRHLRQVMEHEGNLPALAAQARAELTEPSRG